MLFENLKNYYILRYDIYDFLKIVSEVPQPTCLVRTFCALPCQLSLVLLGSQLDEAEHRGICRLAGSLQRPLHFAELGLTFRVMRARAS